MVRLVFLFSLLMLIGCGSRRVATTVDKEEIKEVVHEETTQKNGEVSRTYNQLATSNNTESSQKEIKFVRVKEYNDNGSLKREIESNEETTEIYKNKIETLEESINTKEKIIELLKIQNKEYEKNLKNKSKETESTRPMWWLYVLCYILGLATIPTVKRLIKGKL